MAIPVTNFGLVTVSGTYTSGDTAIVLTTGHGARLPSTDGGYRYALTWWDSTNYPHPADDPNKERVLVIARSGDTISVIRGQEGTSASTKNTGSVTYRMNLSLSKTMWEDSRVVKSTHQGVVLQTHRDMASAPFRVELTACDYIVMNDGTALRNDAGEWNGKVADIQQSGAGGLDSGTEQASQWYEIYAMAKEDNTRSLLLHKSLEWTSDTSNTTGKDSYQNLRAAAANTRVAQGFKLFNSAAVMYVDLILKKVGSPTGELMLSIYSNNAGVPNASLVASQVLDVSRLSPSDTEVRFVFPRSGPVLTGGTQYHLVLSGTWGIDATNYVHWAMDGSAGTYANGSKALYNPTTWTVDTDDDMIFTIGIESGISSVTLPTDYTKYCLLGWVYNDISSNFVPFLQYGRSYRYASLNSNDCAVVTLTGLIQAVNLRKFVPPLDMCTVTMGVTGTGTRSASLGIGDVRATDIEFPDSTLSAQMVTSSGSTTVNPGGFIDVLVERGNVIVIGTTPANMWVSGFKW